MSASHYLFARDAFLTHMEEAIRERDCAGVADIKFAVLEEDGEINIVQNSAATYRTERVTSQKRPIRPPAPGEAPAQKN